MMSEHRGSAAAGSGAAYEFRVAGHLDHHWAEWLGADRLGGVTLTHRADGTSVLAGTVADQAQLHGILGRLRDLGVTLLAVQPECPEPPAAPLPALSRPLTTERLRLRPATAADADATFAYRRLEAVGRWLTQLPTDPEVYRAGFAEPARLSTTIVVEIAGQLIGDLMLRVDDGWAQAEVADRARRCQAELGWVLDPAHTGRGYASEAVRALVTYAFDELKVRRVVANCFLANDASWRLMERLGLRRESHAVAESLHRTGGWLDTVAYAVLASEWDSRRDRVATQGVQIRSRVERRDGGGSH